ncbi:hypothetical protein IWQ60_008776 [Tieghemiomyces parasiticus]|uniref:Complex 1 LYR protein domain-containing protein n=1 Tax=Tieghemiomyces parasiticus TaxID=78921 RepID=A0A9W7ZX77_9FUNG|nr:hypothetical protein IWQ60_008776 [Tieghemiomyces parasiticus]
MSAATRPEVLSLFRSFLRASRQFSSYNFREYVHRRAKDGFELHMAETDPAKVQELIRDARAQLTVAQRQAFINSLYAKDRLVFE